MIQQYHCCAEPSAPRVPTTTYRRAVIVGSERRDVALCKVFEGSGRRLLACFFFFYNRSVWAFWQQLEQRGCASRHIVLKRLSVRANVGMPIFFDISARATTI